MTFSRANSLGWVTGDQITETQINTIDINQSRAVDGNAGGSYAPSAAIVIAGSGVQLTGGIAGATLPISATSVTFSGTDFTWSGTTNLPKIGSRSYTYVQPMAPIWNENIDGAPDFTWTGGSDLASVWTLTNTADDIWFPVQAIPKDGTVTGVTVYIHPQSGHGALPASMPAFEFFSRVVTTGVATSAGTATDSSANVAALELYHSITLSSLSLANDGTRQFYLRFRPESGANSVTGLRFYAITATVTVTQIAPG